MKESLAELLAKQIGHILLQRRWTISFAESCTGGGLAYAITSTPGSSAWFKQSFVTYSNQAKQVLLKVDGQTLASHGAVSEQTVSEMARGCADRAQSEISIAVSGIAGPDGGSDDKPVGLVWFGFSVSGKLHTQKMQFSGDRQQVRQQAIEFSLNHLLQTLEG